MTKPNELNVQIESEYLVFEKHHEEEKKTIFVFVKSKLHSDKLAEIKWFGRWHQYSFFPMPNTVWNKGCLNDIESFIEKLMASRKASLPPSPKGKGIREAI